MLAWSLEMKWLKQATSQFSDLQSRYPWRVTLSALSSLRVSNSQAAPEHKSTTAKTRVFFCRRGLSQAAPMQRWPTWLSSCCLLTSDPATSSPTSLVTCAIQPSASSSKVSQSKSWAAQTPNLQSWTKTQKFQFEWTQASYLCRPFRQDLQEWLPWQSSHLNSPWQILSPLVA